MYSFDCIQYAKREAEGMVHSIYHTSDRGERLLNERALLRAFIAVWIQTLGS